MWRIDNQTPFAADRGWLRDRDGSEVWLVVLKCTFDIHADGTTAVSDEQPVVLRAPEYYGEPGSSSLKYESDLVLRKITTDIVVLGHAYAPPGTTATHVDAGFRVGAVTKVLRAHGDRVWQTFGMSAPTPFTRMPLVYERAYGGVDIASGQRDRDWDERNPAGAGFAVMSENLKGRAVPNLEYPDDPFQSWNDRPKPAAFGPVAGHWQTRSRWAGTYDDRWMSTRQPLLPEDFDDRYYQCVPPDQQAPEFLRGGESVVLVNLTPGGELRFQLPRVFPGFETHFADGSRVMHKERQLHTVILEPDFPRVSLVWHSALPCHPKVHKLSSTIVTLKTPLGDELSGGAEEEDADADSMAAFMEEFTWDDASTGDDNDIGLDE